MDIQIWNFPTGNKIHRLEGFRSEIGGHIQSLAISPDSAFLIASSGSESGSKDQEIKIWDMKTGELKKHFKEVGYSVGSIQFFPNGKKIIYCVDAKRIEIREFPSSNLIKTLSLESVNPNLMKITPDGKRIIYVRGNSVKIRRIKDEVLIASYSADDIPAFYSLDVSKDGDLIALSGWTGSGPYERRYLSIWDFSKRRAEFEKSEQEFQEDMKARTKFETEQKNLLLNQFRNKSKEINGLIHETNYSKAIELLSNYRKQAVKYDLYNIINWIDGKLKVCRVQVIKKTVLGLCTKFARLQIIEISEECGIDNQLIISTVREMIINQEIYAKYFDSSKSVAFDLQANLKEIDNLMATYKKWEDKEVGKF